MLKIEFYKNASTQRQIKLQQIEKLQSEVAAIDAELKSIHPNGGTVDFGTGKLQISGQIRSRRLDQSKVKEFLGDQVDKFMAFGNFYQRISVKMYA